jgi:uncharacterized protein
MSTVACLPPIVPQIQVTLRCNQACTYCFQQHQGRIISISTVETLLRKAIAFNTDKSPFQETATLPVYWHGGEPLLAGIEFFKHIIELQSHFEGVHFDNRIQTNGTLMTEDFARFFVRHGFDVGFSTDGPEALHNRHRKYAAGNHQSGSFAKTMQGIEMFQSVANLEKIPVICVITRDSIRQAKEIFSFFKQMNASVQLDVFDIRTQDLSPYRAEASSLFQLSPKADDLESFFIELFDLWFYDASGQVDFKDFRNEVKMVLQPEMDLGEPYDKRRCDLCRTIVAPDGYVYSCDQYINDPQTALGNIETDDLEKIFQAKMHLWEKMKKHIRQASDRMACNDCAWGRRCNGGCMTCMKYNSQLAYAQNCGMPIADWMMASQDPSLAEISGEFYYCDALRALRKHVEESIAQQIPGPISGRRGPAATHSSSNGNNPIHEYK